MDRGGLVLNNKCGVATTPHLINNEGGGCRRTFQIGKFPTTTPIGGSPHPRYVSQAACFHALCISLTSLVCLPYDVSE